MTQVDSFKYHYYLSLFIADDLGKCVDLFLGYETSPCPRPCQTFHIKTKFVSELKSKAESTMTIRMKFSSKVKITSKSEKTPIGPFYGIDP